MKSSFSCRSSIFGLIFLLIGVSGINISGAATAKYTFPGAPTMIGAIGGLENAVVRWKAPAKNGGKPITSYKVTYYPGAKTQTCKGSRTSCTVMIPNPNKPSSTPKPISFRFIVMAVNAIGVGPASVPSKSTFVKFRASAAKPTTVATPTRTASPTSSLPSGVILPTQASILPSEYGAVPEGKYTIKSRSVVKGADSGWKIEGVGLSLTDLLAFPPTTMMGTYADLYCKASGLIKCALKYIRWNGTYFGWEYSTTSPATGTKAAVTTISYMYFYKEK